MRQCPLPARVDRSGLALPTQTSGEHSCLPPVVVDVGTFEEHGFVAFREKKDPHTPIAVHHVPATFSYVVMPDAFCRRRSIDTAIARIARTIPRPIALNYLRRRSQRNLA